MKGFFQICQGIERMHCRQHRKHSCQFIGAFGVGVDFQTVSDSALRPALTLPTTVGSGCARMLNVCNRAYLKNKS